MERINLKKYGFVRDESRDFSDDGTRFFAYTIGTGRIRVTKTTWEGRVYLSASMSSAVVDYDITRNLPHYQEAENKLNGYSIADLTEEDLKSFANACVEFEKEYIEAEKVESTKMPTRKDALEYYKKLVATRKADYELAKNRVTIDLLLADEKNAARIINRLQSIKKSAEQDPQELANSVSLSCYLKKQIERNECFQHEYNFTYLMEYLDGKSTYIW